MAPKKKRPDCEACGEDPPNVKRVVVKVDGYPIRRWNLCLMCLTYGLARLGVSPEGDRKKN